MDNCIFCKIAKGEIPAKIVYEDDQMMAFHDLSPVSPVHVLVIPKMHIDDVRCLNSENIGVISHLLLKIKDIAKELGVDESGFRLVNNCGVEGGQTVGHLHFHLGGGRQFNWPPG